MSRLALILLLALAVLAVAWGFSHLAPSVPEASSAARVPRRAPAARAAASPGASRPSAAPTGATPDSLATLLPRASATDTGASAALSTSGAGHEATSSAGPGADAEGSSAAAGVAHRAAPLRDLFSYADEGASAPASAAGGAPVLVPAAPSVAPEPTPTPRPVRLVGFVHQAGRLRAALRVHGDVVLAAPGERAGDYAVLALDADAGVRLRGPDGAEFTLRPER